MTLRITLCQYLDRVRAGEELVVTDRGTAVARIVPIDQPRTFSARLVYAEARAALAHAERLGRLTRRQLPRLVDKLDDLYAAAAAFGVATASTSRPRQ